MAFEMLVGLHVINDSEYHTYREKMTPILEQHGGGFGYDFTSLEVLKAKTDAPINRVFSIYFRDEDAKTSFFQNTEYIEVKQRHYDASVSHTTVIAAYST